MELAGNLTANHGFFQLKNKKNMSMFKAGWWNFHAMQQEGCPHDENARTRMRQSVENTAVNQKWVTQIQWNDSYIHKWMYTFIYLSIYLSIYLTIYIYISEWPKSMGWFLPIRLVARSCTSPWSRRPGTLKIHGCYGGRNPAPVYRNPFFLVVSWNGGTPSHHPFLDGEIP